MPKSIFVGFSALLLRVGKQRAGAESPFQGCRSHRLLFGVAVSLLLLSNAANATCPTFHNLTNGSTANADQVMDNYNYILQCPNFTGNVGIGTSSPTGLLNSYSTTVNNPMLVLTNANTTANASVPLFMASQSGGSITNTSIENSGAGKFVIRTGATTEAGFGSARMTITSAGNVGIGATSPTGLLNVSSATVNNPMLVLTDTNTTAAASVPLFIASQSGGGMTNVSLENSGAGNLAIRTGATTETGFGTARMTITAGGNVGINTASPGQALEVNGQIKVDALASASGTSLCINANVIASCSSSRRYKEDIRSAGFGLKEIEAMRPVTFKWKGRDEQDFGLIAEEVAKIDPRYVTYKAGRIEGVKYPQLTAVLVNAVKELKAANDQQAEEIVGLRAQNAAAAGQLKQQAADIQDARNRLAALERKMLVRTAENSVASHH